TLELPGDVGGFAFGDLDGDGYADAAIVAGNELLLLYGARSLNSLRFEPVPVSFGVSRATFGNFVRDQSRRLQIALTGSDGRVHILGHESGVWKEIETLPGVAGGEFQLFRARVSGGAMDDLILLNRDSEALTLIVH